MKSRLTTRLRLPMLCVYVLLGGCAGDPLSLVLDPIVYASGAGDSGGIDPDVQAKVRAELLQNEMQQSCADLTLNWPQTRANWLQSDSSNMAMIVSIREQAIAQKGCTVPTTAAQGTSEVATPAPAVAPATTTGQPYRTDVERYAAEETHENYRGRSCDYLHAQIIVAQWTITEQDPEVSQWGQKMHSVVSQVLTEEGCPPAAWSGGRIGAQITTVDPLKAAPLGMPTVGVLIKNTVPGSPAQQAGLLRGDIILAVDDKPVADAAEFMAHVLKQPVGTWIKAKVWRGVAFDVAVLVSTPAAGQ
ncbi:MAG: S1C family serine protease [Pseudomonas sp.]|uniref:S1C family serine protease n=1 Tax=Pseudomonas sp. TaxID=306 RepID=UPI003D107914